MPEKRTKQRASRARRQGKAATTQAGEFVREEIHHVREGRHGARSAQQAIAIGLSKARRAGVKVRTPRRGQASEETREQARRDNARGRRGTHRVSRRRSAASERALEREPRAAASTTALSRHARSAARRRTAADRHESAMKAARTRRHTGKKSSRARRNGMSVRASR
jgi:hypothetical protein